MDINKVFIIGRLVRDAELRYTEAGMPVSKFSLACNEKRKRGEEWVDEVNYFDIVLWGKTAESLNQYLAKGKQIAIDGKLKQERWQDRDTGNNRSKVTVTALNIQLLNSGNNNNGGGGSEDQYGYGDTGGGYGDSYSAGGYGAGKGGGGYSRSNPGGSASPGTPAPAAQPSVSDDGFEDDIPF
jgi:single-strand DNA-binding protein